MSTYMSTAVGIFVAVAPIYVKAQEDAVEQAVGVYAAAYTHQAPAAVGTIVEALDAQDMVDGVAGRRGRI